MQYDDEVQSSGKASWYTRVLELLHLGRGNIGSNGLTAKAASSSRPWHRPCLLIHPSFCFLYLPSSSGPRRKAAEAAHRCVPPGLQRADGLSQCSAGGLPHPPSLDLHASLTSANIRSSSSRSTPDTANICCGSEHLDLLTPISPFSLGSFAMFYLLQLLAVQV